MDRLEGFASKWTKSFENNIRACLSTYSCFVKVPNGPDAAWNYNPNYWKLDHSQITKRMVQRHFEGLLEWFPEFTSTERKEVLITPRPPPPPYHYTTLHPAPEATARKAEVKFSSFSIDSILKKDTASGLCCKTPTLSEESTERTVGLKWKVNWASSPVGTRTGDSYSISTTGDSQDHELTARSGAAARPTKKRLLVLSPLSQQEKFNHCKTYLAKIAFILQDSPEKRLTFSEVMDRLEAFGLERTKSFENNIRVCLSTSKCFITIPMGWNGLCRNSWTVDHSKITQKILRRHFEGILEWFPELTSVRKEMLTPPPPEAEAAACTAVNSRCEVKFSSSFSIESILNTDR